MPKQPQGNVSSAHGGPFLPAVSLDVWMFGVSMLCWNSAGERSWLCSLPQSRTAKWKQNIIFQSANDTSVWSTHGFFPNYFYCETSNGLYLECAFIFAVINCIIWSVSYLPAPSTQQSSGFWHFLYNQSLIWIFGLLLQLAVSGVFLNLQWCSSESACLLLKARRSQHLQLVRKYFGWVNFPSHINKHFSSAVPGK